MSLTSSSAGSRAILAAALLLPTALLGACSAVDGDGCGNAATDLRRLAEQPLLSSAPADASVPANYRGVGVTTGCDDDSGGAPWLHADRLYAFPGKPDDVISYYTHAAAEAGWHFERHPDPTAPAGAVERACWTRNEQDRHLLLEVDLHPKGFAPEPEVATGLAYSVSVGSDRDGAKESCWH